MSIKSFAGKLYAQIMVNKLRKVTANPIDHQQKIFHQLIQLASNTAFGKDHQFGRINNYDEFKRLIPIRDYEALKKYIQKSVDGEADILWPGRPAYFCKTSGTTSGAKYIPISKDSIAHHVDAAKMALLCYIKESGKADFLNGKMIFLQGSPELSDLNGTPFGRLSGITAHWVPSYLQKNRLPSWETNMIDDWETKVHAIVKETIPEDLRLIIGITNWYQMK